MRLRSCLTPRSGPRCCSCAGPVPAATRSGGSAATLWTTTPPATRGYGSPSAKATPNGSSRCIPTRPPPCKTSLTRPDLAAPLVEYVFLRHGKLMSATTLFDNAFQTICAATGLVDHNGIATISAHRLRHTLGTELAEGGARLQTIMAILGHKSAEMSLIYARISDPEIRRQYEAALAGGGRIAGPAADALLHHTMDPGAVHWLQTNFLKTELELGHCLRLPAEGPCECDLVLTCPKFVTSTEYIPRLRRRLQTEAQLVADAETRGWPREVERHRCTQQRLQALLKQLQTPDHTRPTCEQDQEGASAY